MRNHQEQKAQASQYEAEANQAAFDSQQQMADMQAQMTQMQAHQAAAAPVAAAPAAGSDLMSQLNQLAQLKDAGVLTDEEFTAAKAKLLG